MKVGEIWILKEMGINEIHSTMMMDDLLRRLENTVLKKHDNEGRQDIPSKERIKNETRVKIAAITDERIFFNLCVIQNKEWEECGQHNYSIEVFLERYEKDYELSEQLV